MRCADKKKEIILKHGQGLVTYPDGRTYEGEWENDKMQG